MATRELIHKFERLPVGPLTVDGWAHVIYSMGGQWSVWMATIDVAYDADGNDVPWMDRSEAERVAFPLLPKIKDECGVAIQSAVDEAIYRKDG